MNTRIVDYSKMFLLRDPFASRWLRLTIESEWIHVKEADTVAWGKMKLRVPIKFRGYMGGTAADIIWTGFSPLFCVSQRVIEVLEKNRFIDWSTYPVEVYDRKGKRLVGYHGFAVTSYAGERDLSRSPIIKIESFVPGGRIPEVYKGFYFDENKWDGSDVFRVGAAWRIVTKAVKDVFINENIRNVKFIALSDEETSTSVFMKHNKNQEC